MPEQSATLDLMTDKQVRAAMLRIGTLIRSDSESPRAVTVENLSRRCLDMRVSLRAHLHAAAARRDPAAVDEYRLLDNVTDALVLAETLLEQAGKACDLAAGLLIGKRILLNRDREPEATHAS